MTKEEEAEHKRDLAKIYQRVAIQFALPLAFVSMLPSLLGLYLVHEEVRARCIDTRVDREAIRGSLFDGFEALGYRYDPKTEEITPTGHALAYYIQHPKERAAAIERQLRQIERFPTVEC